MKDAIGWFLTLEATILVIAALTHFGFLAAGWEHAQAGMAETVLATILALGFLATLAWPAKQRLIGLMAQGAALVGTLNGLFLVAIGVGPRTVLDIVYHAILIAVLVWGLIATVRLRQER
jgi:hypothetical protein